MDGQEDEERSGTLDELSEKQPDERLAEEEREETQLQPRVLDDQSEVHGGEGTQL